MPLRLLIAVVLLLPLCSHARCTRPLLVPFEDWPPYSFVDASGRHTGLETELLAAVAAELGCEVRYVRQVPRNRRLPLLLAGELDLLLAATPRPDTARYTLSYREEVYAAFMREGEARTEAGDLEELLRAGLRIVTHRGPLTAPVVDEFRAKGRLTWFEDYAKGVKLMALGRGDVLLGDSIAVAAAARAAGLRLVQLPLIVKRGGVGYKLSPSSMTEADRQAFNQAIQRLEARGELQRIRARWLAPAAPAQTPASRRPARPADAGPGR